ncbi:MAG: hypothetical protein M4579_005815 [Chaenotheca gracillima]|nr:MAG: hypothetical protein M4579_005815 [Chaenotheca gracillima]
MSGEKDASRARSSSPLPRTETLHLTPYAVPPPPQQPPPPYSPYPQYPPPPPRRPSGTQPTFPPPPQTAFPGPPPPLPPRQTPPPTWHSQPVPTGTTTSRDPRTSSTQSLTPSDSASASARQSGKRTLLLIYIHGFLGNEMSFQSFPAHVHNMVTMLVKDTHVVHTKIYPRYKSRKAINYATDDFSNWLAPHESDQTDVVMLGHSMGGILSAEVVLLPPFSPREHRAFRHRILGTINFDTPFLGMHPGVIMSGLSSLFRPQPDPSETTPVPVETPGSSNPSSYFGPINSRQGSSNVSLTPTGTAEGAALSPFASNPSSDPNFNPPFPNDMRMPIRSGWDNALHFVVKHSDGLLKASRQYVTSHLEFGGCLADYKGLKVRYARIRGLEDVDDRQSYGPDGAGRRAEPRVRFVNYYTASSGRPKVSKSPERLASTAPLEVEMQDLKVNVDAEKKKKHLTPSVTGSRTPSPRISVEEHRDDNQIIMHDPEEPLSPPPPPPPMDHLGDSPSPPGSLHRLSPGPISDSEFDAPPATANTATLDTENNPEEDEGTEGGPSRQSSFAPLSHNDSFPPIPREPTPPPPLDPTIYPTKDALKLAEKAYARTLKAHKRAVKDRESALKDRRKLIVKREKQREKLVRTEEKDRLREEKKVLKEEEKERQAKAGRLMQESEDDERLRGDDDESGTDPSGKKKSRDRKFCLTPSKDPARWKQTSSSDGDNDGVGGHANSEGRDPTWVRVYMEGVDEVGAHCGLFFAGAIYEKLVGDVAGRIEGWVREAEDAERARGD